MIVTRMTSGMNIDPMIIIRAYYSSSKNDKSVTNATNFYEPIDSDSPWAGSPPIHRIESATKVWLPITSGGYPKESYGKHYAPIDENYNNPKNWDDDKYIGPLKVYSFDGDKEVNGKSLEKVVENILKSCRICK